MSSIDITIITPVYNGAKFLKKCVETVGKHNELLIQHIFVNDGSTDNTEEVLSNLAKENDITILNFKENLGVVAARNAALSIANGKYIAFLDVDDYWSISKVLIQYNFMESYGLKITCTDYCLDYGGRKLTKVFRVNDVIGFNLLHCDREIICSSVMLQNRGYFFRVLPKDYFAEDFLYWSDFIKNESTQIYRCPNAVTYHTVVKNSRSSKYLSNGYRIFFLYWKVEGICFVKSLFYFLCYILNSLKNKILRQPY